MWEISLVPTDFFLLINSMLLCERMETCRMKELKEFNEQFNAIIAY